MPVTHHHLESKDRGASQRVDNNFMAVLQQLRGCLKGMRANACVGDDAKCQLLPAIADEPQHFGMRRSGAPLQQKRRINTRGKGGNSGGSAHRSVHSEDTVTGAEATCMCRAAKIHSSHILASTVIEYVQNQHVWMIVGRRRRGKKNTNQKKFKLDWLVAVNCFLHDGKIDPVASG